MVGFQQRRQELGGLKYKGEATQGKSTIRVQTNSNDFGSFWNQLADSNSVFFVAKIFFERFEFLVCSKFNHTHHVAVHVLVVASLGPHNSNSNVVVSVTIHDNIETTFSLYIYIYLSEM